MIYVKHGLGRQTALSESTLNFPYIKFGEYIYGEADVIGKNVKIFKTNFLGSFTYIKLNLQRSEGMRRVLFCENKLR